jgi:hypothetical protein
VVESGEGHRDAGAAQFDLRVESDGWTLTDPDQSVVERQWSWETIGGLEVVRGIGKTPDGRSATALDVIVNGWPVRLVVPTEDMTVHVITMLGAFAPLGHPLRGSPRVKGTSSWQRRWTVVQGYARSRLPARPRFIPARPRFLEGIGSPGVRPALVVGVLLVVTAVGASIAGVAISAAPTSATPGHKGQKGTDSVATAGGGSSSQVQGTSSSPGSASPAPAASGGGGGSGAPALIVVRPRSVGPSSAPPPSATAPTDNGNATAPGATPTTAGGTPTTSPGTTATVAPTTTSTRVHRPRPTTTTTTSTTTTQPTTTTTDSTTTTTAPTTTTTTTGLLGIFGF